MKNCTRVACAAALLAVLGVAGPAAAGTPGTDLTAKIHSAPNEKLRYSGRVSSDVEACVPKRKIRITAPGVRIGKAKTNSKGKFELIGKGLKDGTKVTFALKPTSSICIGLKARTTVR